MMEVILIKRCDTDSWNAPTPVVVAVAANEPSAMQWIQDEVDGKHGGGHQYASGHSAEEWLAWGNFRLETVPVYDRI